MTAEWTEIKAKKPAACRVLAALPLRVKMQRLDAMRQRHASQAVEYTSSCSPSIQISFHVGPYPLPEMQ